MATPQHKLCMIPGPIEFHEDVLSAMSAPGTSHLDPAFVNAFGESLEMLRRVVVSQDAQPIILSGSGTLSWDVTICNLMEAGEEMLVINTGYFGDRFGDCATAYGMKVTHVRAPTQGDVPSTSSVKEALGQKKWKLVTITQVDTSTGVLSDVKTLAKLIRETCPDALIVVDGVCSVAAEELKMDEWDVDAVLTASQKALGVPSGLCVMALSQRAMKVYHNRKTPVANYYASLKNWLPILTAYEKRGPSYFATPAVSLIFALHVSLKRILSAGMESQWAKHRESSKWFKDQVQSLGFKLVPTRPEIAANTMTAIYLPKGVKAGDLIPKINAGGIVVAGGLNPDGAPSDFKTTYFRVGHMGISATETERNHLQIAVDAIKNALHQVK